jgi:heme/copper-type cytochrome/quinol oxidase subunit 3
MSSPAAVSVGRRREAVPSSVLGMLIFVGSEVMFFSGLISAFTITRAGLPPLAWTLPSGLVLPAAETAFNSVALLLSGVLVLLAHRQRRAGDMAKAARTLLVGTVLGALFVVLQGREWWGLLSQGVTMQSSTLSAFFYLIVGTHALHAVAAVVALGMAWARLRRGTLSSGFFLGAQTFWYFVVGIWPIIYFRVYF